MFVLILFVVIAVPVAPNDESEYKVQLNHAGETAKIMEKGRSKRDISRFFDDFQSYPEIENYTMELVSNHLNLAETFPIGKSYNGLKLNVIKIGKNSPSRNMIWIDGGIHAREWLSIPTALYIATKLMEDFTKDKDVQSLVRSFDWYILPVVNPDGYIYSRISKNTRLWRKNRSKNSCPLIESQGTDLNRNFPYHWNDPKFRGGDNPCSDVYPGTHAFSEPESKAVGEFLAKHNTSLKLFISLHQFGPTFLTPWSYDPKTPIPDYAALAALAKKGTQAIAALRGTRYNVGLTASSNYPAPGAADDYVYGTLGNKYTFTLEIAKEGKLQPFDVPPKDIIPSAEEIYRAVKAMALAVRDEITKRG